MPRRYTTDIILASASPRRSELLTEAGYRFKVIPSNIDESAFCAESLEPREHAQALALAKARKVAQQYPDSVIIGADTIVDFHGRIVGKPADARDAERITRMLFGEPHKVVTGVAVVCLSDNIELVASDITTVFPRKLTQTQIAEHISAGSWQGKSGAYAIKETGDEFVERIEGSLSNVMGLPMELLQQLLARLA
jgi:septum formation protein